MVNYVNLLVKVGVVLVSSSLITNYVVKKMGKKSTSKKNNFNVEIKNLNVGMESLNAALNNIKEQQNIDKNIKPVTEFSFKASSVRKEVHGYDKRKDRVDFLLREYKKTAQEKNANK